MGRKRKHTEQSKKSARKLRCLAKRSTEMVIAEERTLALESLRRQAEEERQVEQERRAEQGRAAVQQRQSVMEAQQQTAAAERIPAGSGQPEIAGFSSFDMDDIDLLEKNWDCDEKSYKIATSIDDAIMAYYSNSGYTRFNEHHSFSLEYKDKPINVEEISEEVSKEKLSNEEMKDRLMNYHQAYDFNSSLFACGTCGIRQFESSNGSASVKYCRYPLLSLPAIYKYDENQLKQLESWKKKDGIRVPDVDDPNKTIIVEPWRLVSHFVAVEEEEVFHVHQELVETDSEGKQFVMLCPRCYKCVVKGECYKLSIAGGVDFGNYQRIKGLVPPNLHEQLIISKYRLYSALVKVLPNGKGFQRNRGMNWMRGNQILFAHDAPYKIDHRNMSEEDLDSMFMVNFFDENGRNDQMAKRAFGTSKLYARTNVLRQWLTILKELNPQYRDMDSTCTSELITKVQQVTRKKMRNPNFISDRLSLNHEKGLGSDVAGVQQIDAHSSEYSELDSGSRDYWQNEDELPLRTHFVTRSPETILRDEYVTNRIKENGLPKVFEPDCGRGTVLHDHLSEHANDECDTVEQNGVDYVRTNIFEDALPDTTKGYLNSSRASDPMNEFLPNDELLTGAFPWLFPLGKGYGKSAGHLNSVETDHLLKQFHLLHSQDKRLLGYLADVQRRFEVIRKAKLKLTGNKNAIEKVNEFMERNDHEEIMKKLKEDPNSKEAKAIWTNFKSILATVGGNVLYGALESSRCVSQILETAKRYGPGCTFLTLSLDDLFNTRGIRAAIKTVNNEEFPAVFGETAAYHSLDHLISCIKHFAIDHGEGEIDFNVGDGTKFKRSYLSRLASENPIAYVSETKAIINHVLSILIGCPVEGYFGAFDGKSTRKTPYWRKKKGIFGHILAFAGVVEDHVKGTLHFHIILFGSITPYVLQQLSDVPQICKQVAKTLDSFYTAKFSIKGNSRNVLTRMLKKASAFRNIKESRHVPPLLKRSDMTSIINYTEDDNSDRSGSEGVNIQNEEHLPFNESTNESTVLQEMKLVTEDERACNCYHEHHTTCHKGHHGRTCCRFARASGCCICTCCVILEPNEEKKRQKDREDIPEYTVRTIENKEYPTHILKNPLDRSQWTHKKNLVVWELERPKVDFSKVSGFDTALTKLEDANGVNEEALRKTIMKNLQVLLKDENDPIQHIYDESSKIWISLREESIEKVKSLYFQFLGNLSKANQYCVEHSVPLFYCTGSHNNASLLGGFHQAKAAMFYIAPYMSKEKASLTVCLTSLEKARKEVLKHPSKAEDRTTKPQERLTKHFLTRVINKLHAYTELSDYQVAAYLLKLPSILTSETFAYTETYGAINYMQELENEIRSGPESGGTNNDVYFGHIQTFTIEERDVGKDIKMAIPVVSMYFHRGDALKDLSLYEYCAIIQVKVWPKTETNRSQWFSFGGGYHLQARYGQTLCAKQKTLIFKGGVPSHPGEIQRRWTKAKKKAWRKKANKYARYMLTMFRPSSIYKGNQHSVEEVKQGYKWKHLKSFVSSLQEDNKVISKFRIMAMDRRMNTLISHYESMKLLSAYRFREVDKWTDVQKTIYKRDQHLQQFYEKQSDLQVLEDYEFETKYCDKLDGRTSIFANEMNDDAAAFSAAAKSATGYGDDIPIPSLQQSRKIICQTDMGVWTQNCEKIYNENKDNIQDDDTDADTEDETNPTKSYLCFSKQELDDRISELNDGQREIVDAYREYLSSTTKKCRNPPPKTVLLTGKGGTGKSHVIHTLLHLGMNKTTGYNNVWTMATNNLNAADINGFTIASVLKYAIQDSSKKKGNNTMKVNQRALSELDRQNVEDVKLLIIDEISNVTASKLGQLSRLFAHSLQKPEEFFGGIPVLLVGDFNQKEPVGGVLATTSLMKACKIQSQMQSNTGIEKLAIRIFSEKNPKSNSILEDTDLNDSSDCSEGCKILASAVWFELTKPERSKDNKHNNQVDSMYKRNPIEPSQFRKYKIYNQDTLKNDSEQELVKWLKAPVIVKTNRERITINYERALDFARRTNKVIVRWPSDYSHWEGKPQSEEDVQSTISTDSAFWEIFVKDGPCYLTDTISKMRKLCNGTRATFHSLVLDRSQRISFEGQIRLGQRVITLDTAPMGINLKIEEENVLKSSDWKGFRHNPRYAQTKRKQVRKRSRKAKSTLKSIIVPIRPGCKNNNDKPMFVKTPNILVSPSRVAIKQTYPIQGGFAITVDKAQGQTLDRVILALSERKHRLSRFTYSCVYVGASRVRETDHMRLLLKESVNPRVQWETLNYLTTLKPNDSIEPYFAGFQGDKRKWKSIHWNESKAMDSTQTRKNRR